MEPLVIAAATVLLGAATGAGIWWELRQAAKRRERLHATAAALGLTYRRGRRSVPESFVGEFDGVPVEVKLLRIVVPAGKGVMVVLRTQFEAHVPGCGLAVSAEGFGTTLQKMFTGRDVPTGDPDFDVEAFVKGDDAEALARLGPEARKGLSWALGTKGGLKDGIVSAVIPGHAETPKQILEVLRPVTRTAAALNLSGKSLPAALMEAVRSDPPRRARALELLVRRFPEAPETAEACRLLRDDADPFVRIHAALGLGEIDTVRALVNEAALPAETRAFAVDRLRAGGSAAGGLAIAPHDAEAGALSVAESEAEGNLSLAARTKRTPTSR